MSMLMGHSLPPCVHESSMSMLMELSCARAHGACTRTTTLGKSATGLQSVSSLLVGKWFCRVFRNSSHILFLVSYVPRPWEVISGGDLLSMGGQSLHAGSDTLLFARYAKHM